MGRSHLPTIECIPKSRLTRGWYNYRTEGATFRLVSTREEANKSLGRVLTGLRLGGATLVDHAVGGVVEAVATGLNVGAPAVAVGVDARRAVERPVARGQLVVVRGKGAAPDVLRRQVGRAERRTRRVVAGIGAHVEVVRATHRRVAGVVGVQVAVIAVGGHVLAQPRDGVARVVGARVVVVARRPRAHAHAVRGAYVGRARVAVVTVLGGVRAARRRVARVDGAGVLVVAGDGRSAHARTRAAHLTVGAGVAVGAHVTVQQRIVVEALVDGLHAVIERAFLVVAAHIVGVDAPGGRVARVDGAEQAVVAIDGRATVARARAAHLVLGAGVVVVARERVVRVRAARRRVARVVGAGVLVVAIERDARLAAELHVAGLGAVAGVAVVAVDDRVHAARHRAAVIERARVAVVAVDGGVVAAPRVHRAVVLGARVAVVADNGHELARAALHARVVRAGVEVVADDRLEYATDDAVAIIVGARVAVVADDQRGHAHACVADVSLGADVAVVAGRDVRRGRAALRRVAVVVGAGVLVVAVERDARLAAQRGVAGLEPVADVLVVAHERDSGLETEDRVAGFATVAHVAVVVVDGRVLATRAGVARVGGAGVQVVLAHRRRAGATVDATARVVRAEVAVFAQRVAVVVDDGVTVVVEPIADLRRFGVDGAVVVVLVAALEGTRQRLGGLLAPPVAIFVGAGTRLRRVVVARHEHRGEQHQHQQPVDVAHCALLKVVHRPSHLPLPCGSDDYGNKFAKKIFKNFIARLSP